MKANPIKAVDVYGLLPIIPSNIPFAGNGPFGSVCGTQENSGLVPDKPFGLFNFSPLCEAHDKCYECDGGESRVGCDLNFASDAASKVCVKYALIPGLYSSCVSTASFYSLILIIVGEKAFEEARAGCPDGDCE